MIRIVRSNIFSIHSSEGFYPTFLNLSTKQCCLQKTHRAQLFISQQRNIFSSSLSYSPENKSGKITKVSEESQGQLSLGKKVKQAGKDVSYFGIVVLGVGVTGLMFFAIGRELFSGQSPNGVYSKAFKLCENNEQVRDLLGCPIKGFGELTRRGRRRHVNHQEYKVDGVDYMRMKFYLEGTLEKATAQLEVFKKSGKYEFRYLFVQMDNYPHKTIIVEDNR